MNYRFLQSTDLKVADICLGTVKYGDQINEEQAHQQMTEYQELGGNFIDTAHIYCDWCGGEKAKSERIVGRWMKKMGNRHDIILSTKGAHPDLNSYSVSRVTPECIRKDLDESLEVLQTDYIDLYFLHRDNMDVPAAELLGALEGARKQGKIRWYGCSNWTLPRIQEADQLCSKGEFSGFVCNQLMWSLADVNMWVLSQNDLVAMDEDTYAYHEATQKSVMAYTSAAQGYLTKRIKNIPMNQKFHDRYQNESNEKILQLLKEYDVPVSEFAFAYLINQGFTTVPIVTFRTREQLEEGMRSSDLTIPKGLLEEIKKVKKYYYSR